MCFDPRLPSNTSIQVSQNVQLRQNFNVPQILAEAAEDLKTLQRNITANENAQANVLITLISLEALVHKKSNQYCSVYSQGHKRVVETYKDSYPEK